MARKTREFCEMQKRRRAEQDRVQAQFEQIARSQADMQAKYDQQLALLEGQKLANEQLKKANDEQIQRLRDEAKQEQEDDDTLRDKRSMMAARAKAAQLKLQIDLLRRGAVHTQHLVSAGADDAISVESKQAWIAISRWNPMFFLIGSFARLSCRYTLKPFMPSRSL